MQPPATTETGVLTDVRHDPFLPAITVSSMWRSTQRLKTVSSVSGAGGCTPRDRDGDTWHRSIPRMLVRFHTCLQRTRTKAMRINFWRDVTPCRRAFPDVWTKRGTSALKGWGVHSSWSLNPWRRRYQVSSKRRETQRHGVTTGKTWIPNTQRSFISLLLPVPNTAVTIHVQSRWWPGSCPSSGTWRRTVWWRCTDVAEGFTAPRG